MPLVKAWRGAPFGRLNRYNGGCQARYIHPWDYRPATKEPSRRDIRHQTRAARVRWNRRRHGQ